VAPGGGLSVTAIWARPRATIRLGSELDSSTSRLLRAKIDKLLRDRVDHLVVDLHNLEFIDSTAVHSLASAHAERGAKRFSLRVGSGAGAGSWS
jgi:anti-anti-sigma factor